MKVAECLAADSSLETLPVEIFLGQTAPENLLGKIRKFNPSHLLVTDAVSFGGRPGDIRLFLREDLRGGTFSTHGFPLSVFLEYARKEFRCEALVVGIEPESVTVGKPLSKVVGERLGTVARAVREALVEVFASGASGQKNGEK